MIIYGLYGDEAIERFRPGQFVNIYETDTRAFYCEASMDTLPEEVRDDLESFFLEPTTEDGIPVPLESALKEQTAA